MSKIEAPPPGFHLLHVLAAEVETWFGRLKWSPDGRRIAAGASDEMIWVWETKTGQLLRRIKGGTQSLVAFSWSDKSRIVTWGSDQPSLRSQSVVGGWSRDIKLEGLSTALVTLEYSPDKRMVAGVTEDKKVKFWDAGTGRLVREVEEVWGSREIAWSPTGAQIALIGREGGSPIIDIQTGEEIVLLPTPRFSVVRGFSWTPDAKLCAFGLDQTILIRNSDTGHFSRRLEGHQGRIKALSFAVDGSLLASKSYDGTVRLWRCDRWEEVTMLKEPTSGAWPPSVEFHPQDLVLASLDKDDKSIRIWRLDLLSEAVERERRRLVGLEKECQRLSALEWDIRVWIITNLVKLSSVQKRHLFEGFLQRHLMMSASRERIFRETHNRGNLLDPDLVVELNIHVNAYYLNLRGALDNLAWLLAFGFELKPGLSEEGKGNQFVDLFHEKFHLELAKKCPCLVTWLKKVDKWRRSIKDFRDPAAHRIPLYVAPGIHTDGNRERREALERASVEAVDRKDFSVFTSLQNEIRNLAEYKPAFVKSGEGRLDVYWLAGQIQRDQRVFLRIARTVLREWLGPLSLMDYRSWLARCRRRSAWVR